MLDNERLALGGAIAFLCGLKQARPNADKAKVEAAFSQRSGAIKKRSVFVGHGYAMRFSEARTGSFSNTVLSLSALHAHDALPFVIVVVRRRSNSFSLTRRFSRRSATVPFNSESTTSEAASTAQTS
jgi:hypothetical protein